MAIMGNTSTQLNVLQHLLTMAYREALCLGKGCIVCGRVKLDKSFLHSSHMWLLFSPDRQAQQYPFEGINHEFL